MILLDCGNHSLKAQFWNNGTLQGSFTSLYGSHWPLRLGHWVQGLPASHCYLASVLDAARQEQLDQCLVARFATEITRLASRPESLGVINGYRNPETLGVDRWLALIAAAELTDGDCIVIDAGSAITLDLLRADGQHLGGAILPGVNTTLDRFRQIFSHIDFDQVDIAETTEPGCSTATGIHIDYANRSIDYLPGLVNRWTNHLEEDATVLLAGGDAARVQRELDQPGRIVPDLVFRGMLRLARQ